MNKSFIAVVDDDAAVGRAFARILRASQFDVSLFDSGHQFLESLTQRKPDCVILDYQLPGLCAADVQKLLAVANGDIPVIVVTADERAGMREQCLANGAVAFLTKPLRCEDLLASIAAAIGPTAPK